MTAKSEGVKTQKKPVPTVNTLNKAAQLILDQMPDYVDQLVTDIATQAILPKWQLVGGILFEAYNNGYLSAYTLDPAWKDGFKLEESECGFCREKYMPIRVGQQFCCNECGQGRPKIGEEEFMVKEAMQKLAAKKKKKETKSGKDNPILSDLIKSNTKRVSDKKVSKKSGAGWVDGVLD